MSLKSQVCSKELSMKLKELGVEKESFFEWFESKHEKSSCVIYRGTNGYGAGETYSAFTASELLELLPGEISRDLIKYTYLLILKKNHEYEIRYDEIRYDSCMLDDIQCIEFGDTLTNALAKMLIYLLENK